MAVTVIATPVVIISSPPTPSPSPGCGRYALDWRVQGPGPHTGCKSRLCRLLAMWPRACGMAPLCLGLPTSEVGARLGPPQGCGGVVEMCVQVPGSLGCQVGGLPAPGLTSWLVGQSMSNLFLRSFSQAGCWRAGLRARGFMPGSGAPWSPRGPPEGRFGEQMGSCCKAGAWPSGSAQHVLDAVPTEPSASRP